MGGQEEGVGGVGEGCLVELTEDFRHKGTNRRGGGAFGGFWKGHFWGVCGGFLIASLERGISGVLGRSNFKVFSK